jgi:hypothetical protein
MRWHLAAHNAADERLTKGLGQWHDMKAICTADYVRHEMP